jgi:hypothetical protein
MKKILVILLLIISFSSIYGVKHLKLTEINIKPANCDWTGWLKCQPGPIDVEFNPEIQSITIFSDSIQKYTYKELTQTIRPKYSTYSGDVIDNNGKRAYVVMYQFNDLYYIILNIKYLDGEFKYKIEN